jgi:hypothetical protein
LEGLVDRVDSFIGHLCRAENQERRINNIMTELPEDTCYIIFDMMMKWIPLKFKEEQSDWFGKSGISVAGITFMMRQIDEKGKVTKKMSKMNLRQRLII